MLIYAQQKRILRNAIDRLSIIWKSNLSNKIKNTYFFKAVSVSILLYGCTIWMLIKCIEKKLDRINVKMLQAILNKSWRQHPRHNSCTATYIPSQKLSKCCIVTIQLYKYTGAAKYETLTTLRCSSTKRILTSWL